MGKKIILISIQMQDFQNSRFRSPPLGMLQLSSMIKNNKHICHVFDYGEKDKNLINDLILKIKKIKPDVVGFTISTPLFNIIKKISKEIKKQFPDLILASGGPHPTINPIETLKNTMLDVVFLGESDLSFIEFLDNLSLKELPFALLKTKGIYYKDKKNNKIIKTPKQEIPRNLDKLPLPDWDQINLKNYIPLPNQYKKLPLIPIITSRGCPFKCTFCSIPQERIFRQRSVKSIIDEIKEYKKKYGIKEIYFYDDTLTINKKWVKELCNSIIKEKLNISWSCFARIDTVNEEILQLMSKSGCWNIFYGIECGYQEGLDKLSKNLDIEAIRKIVKLTRKAKIDIRASFILGLPWESIEEIKKTIKFSKSLNLDYAQYNLFTPYPGTQLYDEALKTGKFSKNLRDFNLWDTPYTPPQIKNRKELMKIQKNAFRSFYYNPFHILKMLLKIRSFSDIYRHFKAIKYLILKY
ncbi:hypothetical protein C0585_01310 [Candidatus Woesearchaeota archaeon]|nr:MAG: hypothetical protein C0585_01310 [Candidatus Woesearchaeota archaeon]